MDESEQIPPAMKKRQRRIIIGICLFFGAILLAGIHQRLYGVHLLRGTLADLEKAKEKLSYHEFSIQVPHPTNNITQGLLGFTNELKSFGHSMWRHPPPIDWMVNGELHVALSDTNPITDNSNVTTFRHTWFQHVPDLGSSNKLISDVLTVASRPAFYSGFEPKHYYHERLAWMSIHAGGTKDLLIAAILFSAMKGNGPETSRRVRAFANFISGMKTEPLVITQAVRQAFAERLFLLQWQLLQSLDWNDAELSEWQDFWSDQEFAKEFAQALRIERALHFEHLCQLSGSIGTRSKQNRAWNWTRDIDNPVLRNSASRMIAVSAWHLMWKEQDIVNGLGHWNTLIRKLDSIASRHSPRGIVLTKRRQTSWLDRYRFLFTNNDDLREYARVPETALRSETLRSLAIGGIAIHRFMLRHRNPPASLEKLKPSFLSDMPMDPYDRKPLRYFVDGEDWVLYSIGENVDDDGGQVEIGQPGKEIRSIFDGADIVWPRPALPEHQTKELQKN